MEGAAVTGIGHMCGRKYIIVGCIKKKKVKRIFLTWFFKPCFHQIVASEVKVTLVACWSQQSQRGLHAIIAPRFQLVAAAGATNCNCLHMAYIARICRRLAKNKLKKLIKNEQTKSQQSQIFTLSHHNSGCPMVTSSVWSSLKSWSWYKFVYYCWFVMWSHKLLYKVKFIRLVYINWRSGSCKKLSDTCGSSRKLL